MSDDERYQVDRHKSPRLLASSITKKRLGELKKQRGTLKGRLTLFEKYITKFEKVELNTITKAELDLRIQSNSVIFQNFNDIQGEIEELSEDSELMSQLDYRESFEEQYFSLMAAAKCILNDSEKTSQNTVVNNPVSIKLPVIKLPAFDGSFDQWLEYRNSYLTMIHNREDLDAIQKFHYLKSSLSGSASHVISALEFTAPNYVHAWDLLENRFHNNRLLVQNHVKSLFTTQSLSSESSVEIRKLIDSTLRNLRALNSLNEPTDSWDTLIEYLVVSKLDPSTEREWETYKGSLVSKLKDSKDSIKLSDLLDFLRNRADMLEMIKSSSSKKVNSSKHSNNDSNRPSSDRNKKHSASTISYVSTQTRHSADKNKQKRACVLCGNDHNLYSCAKFLNMSVQNRHTIVRDSKLCQNCIRTDNHSPNECSFNACKFCQKKHNTLLHNDTIPSESVGMVASTLSSRPVSNAGNKSADSERNVLMCNTAVQPVLLSTALIDVPDSRNDYHTVKALLDNGSQNCFITESLCNRLQLPIIQSTINISGVGQTVSKSSHTCKINIRSKVNDFKTEIQCLVLPSITSKIPSIDVDCECIRIPNHISLADPTFNVPSDIDILLGADIFWDLLNKNKIKLRSGPHLHETKIGWIISGPIRCNRSVNIDRVQCNFVQIDSQLRKFWELEELTDLPSAMSKDDRYCETLFTETTQRDDHGRFSVRIPLKESADLLGDSYITAKNRFFSLERKLNRLPQYKQLYCDFMQEYEGLGHMSPVSENVNDILNKPHYILPHHGVYRENSLTTKLRVVFDASASTSTDRSLNDIQYIGPSLQNDIFSILLRFRQYKYVVCADVEKMYRQILIQTDQRNLQLILWRKHRDLPLQLYRLNTVTYGTASAPFLSIRCIKQLAQECDDKLVARTIHDDFYVDDLITGHDDLDSLIDLCNKTTEVLRKACFPLHKWTFSHEVCPEVTKDLNISESHLSKTLGLGWFTESDELHFATKFTRNDSVVTKRIMLSVISQIYDPLGLLAPAVIIAKSLLQKLWLHKLDWDEEIPVNMENVWRSFISNLIYLSDIKIPRYVTRINAQYKELHVFTDASQIAYGACAYMRSCYDDCDDSSPICVHLLCAKSKLAPIKTVSIPRLELCGALVGAKLYHKIKKSLRLTIDKVYFWTDSTIVQGWLRMPPPSLKTFVQNRVVQINELTDDIIWRHVKGTENPADLITRGASLDSLKYDNNSHWWCGPQFLREPSIDWSNSKQQSIHVALPEIKSHAISLVSTQSNNCIDVERFSSFIRLQRAGAYLLRFIDNTRAPRADSHRTRKTGLLSADELHHSLTMLTRLTQQQSFNDEYHNLENKLPLKVKGNKSFNKISGLNIFLDEFNIIRVGGRLCNATDFSYEKKHPILLSGKHRFTRLLCEYEHKRLLHAGPQHLVYSMREKWWVLGARNLARQIVHNCITCTRMKGKTLTPIMGNLPSERLEASFPFMQCGVDYAGPMLILNRKGRGANLIKAYICLFVCFTTRAVHLELVGSLTTQDYLLALKRFISRRGKPYQIFSDNGKNFVGAEKELSVIFKNSNDILDFTSNNQIRLTFIPPYSPHFGGLWEAGVKSCKYHLRRVLGNARLTYEEFATVLTQIEAVLNSRPLSPLSSDPNDFLPLTPAHFLVGRPLTAPACKDLTNITPTRLVRYQRVEQLRQHFWQRWSKEYISELQQRIKWKVAREDIIHDSLVLIKEENLPPLKWKMGRVTQVFPGNDGVARVAEIRTAAGTIRRAFSKICPLPVTQPSC